MKVSFTKEDLSKLNQTQRVVLAIKKSIGKKRPIDNLKIIKDSVLKDIGFTISPENKKTGAFFVEYEPVKIKGDGKGTPNEEYTPSTIYDLLRSYRTTIKSMNVKHNTLNNKHDPIKSFKANWGEKIENLGYKEILDNLDSNSDLPEIRLAVKRLSMALRGNKAIRIPLKQIKIESQAYYWIEACMEKVSVLVNDKQSESFREQQNNKVLINPNYVLTWAKDILNDKSSNYEKLCLALMAVTGRRTTEIMKTAIFTKTEKEDYVLFDGQLKQKDREALGTGAGSYEVPVLVDSSVVIKALKRLRALTKNDTIQFMQNSGVQKEVKLLDKAFRLDVRHSEGVNDKYASLLSSQIKRLFNSEIMRPYLFRSAYTEIAYNNGMQNKGETRQAFRMRVLGHVNFTSQGNYDKFGLSTEVKTIGLERFGDDKATADQELIKLLEKTQGTVLKNTRAKAMHRLHAYTLELAKSGEVKLSDINATWTRSQIVDGKKIGAATVKQWLEVLGL